MDLLLQINPKFGQGGRGSKNPKNLADVLNGWPLTGVCIADDPVREGDEDGGVFLPDILEVTPTTNNL